VEIFEQVSKVLPPFLFLSFSLSLLKLSSKTKTKTKTLQRAVSHRRKLQRYWPLPQQQAATRCRPRHSNELQRSAGLAIATSCNILPASP
jgi:hypothetical protein